MVSLNSASAGQAAPGTSCPTPHPGSWQLLLGQQIRVNTSGDPGLVLPNRRAQSSPAGYISLEKVINWQKYFNVINACKICGKGESYRESGVCLVTQSCLTLCNPWTIAHQVPLTIGILQARILEWVATPSSSGIFPTQGSNPGLPALQVDSLPSEPLGKPKNLEGNPKMKIKTKSHLITVSCEPQ